MPRATTTKTKTPTKTTTKTVSRPAAKAISKSLLSRKLNFKSPQMWAVIALVVAVGGYLIYRSFAATPPGNGMIAYGCGGTTPYGDGEKICVMQPDGSGSRVLVDANSQTATDLSWSPDGQKIAFIGGAGNLKIADFNGNHIHDISAGFPRTKISDPGQVEFIDANNIMFYGFGGNGLYAMKIDGTNFRTLIADNPTYKYTSYQISPDKTKILAQKAATSTSNEAIYLYDINGANQQKLFDVSHQRAYTWAPDGNLIEFANDSTAGGFAVNKVHKDGSLIAQLIAPSQTATYCSPGNSATIGLSRNAQSWSPDGTKLLFGCAPSSTLNPVPHYSQLLVYDSQTGVVKSLHTQPANTASLIATWQPDPLLAKPKYGWYVSGVGYLGQYGGANLGDIPVPADYNGDNTSDVAVFRPTDGKWYVKGIAGYPKAYGTSGDVPLPGDFNGDGKAEPVVIRRDGLHDLYFGAANNFSPTCSGVELLCPVTVLRMTKAEAGTDPIRDFIALPYSIDLSNNHMSWETQWFDRGSWATVGSSDMRDSGNTDFGMATDIPTPGHYIDGQMHLAEWRPSNGTWYVHTGSQTSGQYASLQFGASGDIPMPGDYNGDGITDYALFRPSNGYWYVKDGKTKADIMAKMYGNLPGDMPIHFVLHGKTVPAVVRREN